MKFLRRFNSSDRDAAIVLVLVIIVSLVLFPYLSEQDKETSSSKAAKSEYSNYSEYSDNSDKKLPSRNNFQLSIANCQLFKFDPNTASESQLLSLGLSQRQVRNILKYRSRGGRYRVKEDFARLYGLTLEKYRQLEPYITIKPEVMAADVIKPGENSSRSSNSSGSLNSSGKKDSSLVTLHSSLRNKLRYGETVDINTADTAMLKRIPGIGDYFAMRIVELRKRKQVFSSPEELLVIRNFPETALTYMTASQNFPPIYVNQLSQKDLAAHPLLNYAQARDIVSLRRISGTIKTVTDLAGLPSFDTKTIARITPLLRFEKYESMKE